MIPDDRKEDAEWTVRLALTKGRADLIVIQDLLVAGWEEATARQLVQQVRQELNRSQSKKELAHLDMDALQAQMDADRQRDGMIAARAARLALKGIPVD